MFVSTPSQRDISVGPLPPAGISTSALYNCPSSCTIASFAYEWKLSHSPLNLGSIVPLKSKSAYVVSKRYTLPLLPSLRTYSLYVSSVVNAVSKPIPNFSSAVGTFETNCSNK